MDSSKDLTVGPSLGYINQRPGSKTEKYRVGKSRKGERDNAAYRRNSSGSLDSVQFGSDVDRTSILGLAAGVVSDDGGVA